MTSTSSFIRFLRNKKKLKKNSSFHPRKFPLADCCFAILLSFVNSWKIKFIFERNYKKLTLKLFGLNSLKNHFGWFHKTKKIRECHLKHLMAFKFWRFILCFFRKLKLFVEGLSHDSCFSLWLFWYLGNFVINDNA